MRALFVFVLLLLTTFIVKAQGPCTGPGRLPTTAQAVCGNLTFNERDVTNCSGPDIPNPTSGCGQVTSDNSRWYKFHCYQSGTLGFLITPQNLADDYDWEVMDITGFLPGDVYTMELRVSLNLSGQAGITGCTAAGVSDVNCGGGAPGTQFNRFINLLAGHDYLMMVNNWSSSNQGYDIDFSGTAVLTNNTAPTATGVNIVGCDPTKLEVTFSEDILCSSISPIAGTEFSITAGTHTITGIVSDCSLGANGIPSLIINLQAPLPAGNYQLNINVGSDGNTLENVCRIEMLPVSIPFTIPAITPAAVSSVNYTGCAPTVLNVTLTKPIWCTSLSAPPGSEFSIMPGNPAIQSIISTCTSGSTYIDQLQIVLQNPLTFGNYQLVVNNGADGNTLVDTCYNNITAGYNFPFTIVQTTIAPIIQTVDFDECHPDKVVINFDKPVLCATITANAPGRELSISPGNWPIASIIYNCTNSLYTQQITLNMAGPLPAGNFNVLVSGGIDGNTLSDTCFAFMPVGYTKPFITTQAPPPVFDSVQIEKCNPTSLKVFYNHPILCNSIVPSGGQFWINTPSVVNIISATGDATCGSLGYTNWIQLQFSAPITTPGTYRLYVPNLGAAIVDTCNAIQQPFEFIYFDVLGKPSAAFNAQVNWGCVNDTIVFSHPGGNGANSWNWTFSDGSTATGQTVSRIFPVATPLVTTQLIVSNGYCSDTASQTTTLGNVFNAAFTTSPGDTVCINTPVNFTDASTGAITNYLWDFGDLTQYNGQNPPTHVYPVSNTYNVQLIVTDNYGCRDTASRLMQVDASAQIDFIGLKPQYCTGNIVSLTRKISRNIISYVWDNGDGKTFSNEVDVTFAYANEGVYTISLSGIDRYCGPATISKTVPVYAVPKVNIGSDTVICQSDRLLIGVAPNAAYTYSWNTGATTSQVYTDLFTRDYNLTADNHGCRGYDALHVKVLPACLIKVPNAFTPNGDGLNDVLKPVYADLAKNFSFKIFNRVGQLIFTSNNPLDGWDGKFKGNPVETGTFVWTLSYVDPWTGKTMQEKGTSILIR